ncbi:MAG: HAD family hydrolase [Chloroflexota bacterium]|nr:MAG: HAD family hydrolase [Chloroflexota bacterium]
MASSILSVWPISGLVIFDCDSTLCTIEGIDELARLVAGEGESAGRIAVNIAQLTKQAMEGDIPLEAVYNRRLVAVNPTLGQVRHIASIYRERSLSDAAAVIDALQTLGVQVFIVSGGLVEPVKEFGKWLGIPEAHIFAVDMEYDQLAGEWWRYWEQPGGQNPHANYLAVESNPLTGALGKNRIIARIRSEFPGRALMVGDGLSDLEAGAEVDLFVGFGGAVFRQRVFDEAAIYIRTPALSPILPLALGQLGNDPRFASLWADGLRRVYTHEVTFKDTSLQEAFFSSLRRVNGP